MSDERSGDYEVGYGKPPQHSKWPKGTSGNPKGTPKRKKGPIDITAILEEPVTVIRKGRPQKMQAFEASVRRQAQKAIKDKSISAISKFLKLCEKHGVMKPPEPEWQGGVIHAPAGVDFYDWFYSVTEPIPPGGGEDDDV